MNETPTGRGTARRASSAAGRAGGAAERPQLTDKQRQVLTFLTRAQREGRWPTLKEIAQRIGARAPAAAHHHLKRLEAKGYLRRAAWGAYELTPQVQMLEGLGVARVPVRGTIAAGTGVEAVEAVEDWLTVDSVFARHPDVYALRVQGDSMVDACVCDGDHVLIRPQPGAENGEMVAALRDDGTATLKNLHREGGNVFLVPANPHYPPLPGDNITILGKVVGVIRVFA